MASELERKLAELEGLREERCWGVDGCEGARRGGAGAMVSPSMPSLSPASVASLLESTNLPHPEQYRLASAISLEQEGQRMTSGDCITAAAYSLSTDVRWRLSHCRGSRRGHANLAPMEERRRTVSRDGQQGHGLDAKENAESLQRAAKQAAENIGPERVGRVASLLKHLGKD